MEVKRYRDQDLRTVTRTIKLTERDAERLDRIAYLLSPYAPLSLGKTVSIALEIADDKFKQQKIISKYKARV